MNIWLTIGGYASAAVLLWLLLETREELGAQIEQCNTEKITAIAEAERLTREVLDAAHAEQIAQLQSRLQAERNARVIAEEARVEAESRIPEVRTIIREVASENSCIDTIIPGAVIERLR